ncbi:hypothetical protein [Planctopirus hydrillae]|uniref:DNA polymerase III beta sliding clamp central domain-containing protein n=1 Tax=Planctopirus hydrillae TaxID=1841610 RepID=A0A1C3E946_9PLAN|nr:hypothetical protein [Planctopirus hydrillae]ODA29741.1 hypothetical protein A6X21_07575 [Planctopirus hydrillae]
MFQFSRQTARQVLTAFRHAGLVHFSRRIQPPVTLIQRGTQLQMLCLTPEVWVLWQNFDPSRSPTPSPLTELSLGHAEQVTVPATLLRDVQGTTPDIVTIEVDQDLIKARWTTSGFEMEREYQRMDPPEGWPRALWSELVEAPPGFLAALQRVMSLRDPSIKRYSLSCVQYSAQHQRLAGSNGHQLLIWNGLPLPWSDDLLLAGTDIFALPEWERASTVHLARTPTDFVVQTGSWVVGLKIETEGRYPLIDRVVPQLSETASQMELHPVDACRLIELLEHLPQAQISSEERIHQPLTVDLSQEFPVIRIQTRCSARATEIQLMRSTCWGTPGAISLETRYLLSALKMGFQQLGFQSSESAVRLDTPDALYVIMPLTRDSLIPPGDHHVLATGQPQSGTREPIGLPAMRLEPVHPVSENSPVEISRSPFHKAHSRETIIV